MAINIAILATIMRIAFVVCEQLLTTSIALPVEMIRSAAELARVRQRIPAPEICFVASQRGEYLGHSGLPIHAGTGLDDGQYQLVFLPALWRNPQLMVQRHKALMPWLWQQHEGGALIGAAGTGVCFLAASGLLDAHPATTHWSYLDQFSARYPAVDLKPQYLITRAGNLYCAASINALADLTVHFIHHFFGSHIAKHVERHFSQEARRAYENITYREEDSEHHHDEDIIRVQLWLRQHLHQHTGLAAVARHFGMSQRNFNRRFLAATGKTPLQYLQQLRLEESRDLLANSNLRIGEVAERVGYQDSAHFSRLFCQWTGITPQQYRKTIRSKLFSVDVAN